MKDTETNFVPSENSPAAPFIAQMKAEMNKMKQSMPDMKAEMNKMKQSMPDMKALEK